MLEIRAYLQTNGLLDRELKIHRQSDGSWVLTISYDQQVRIVFDTTLQQPNNERTN